MDKEKLYCIIKNQILTNELKPGDRLDEVGFSKKYNVSRTPLRDIFFRLSGEGYLNMIANKGATVSSLDIQTLHNFFTMAPMIYSVVGKLATKNASTGQIKSLEKIQSHFQKAIDKNNTDEMVLWNQQFHSLIGEMADNPYIQPSYDRLLVDHARISRTFYGRMSNDNAPILAHASDHHNQMIAAIEAHDADKMIRITKAHWDLSKTRIQLFVESDALHTEEFIT